MVEESRSGRLAVILHADVAGSTEMVQQDEHLAHERIQDAFRRLSHTIEKYSGSVLELRGDALLAEFERPSNAVSATFAFQASNTELISSLEDNLKPVIRIGIAMGEVVVADNTATGAGVVLAQRVEQLAKPGSVCITAAVHEALPGRMPFDYENLGEQQVKGFSDPVRVYMVNLEIDGKIPEPEILHSPKSSLSAMVWTIVAGIILLIGLAYIFSIETDQPPPQDRPSIVVLPFENLSGDDEQDYFAAGITRGIATYLSKFKELFVISHTTAVTYKEQSKTAKEIGQELRVAYVLEGGVQRGAENLSVHVQLIEAATERNVWSEEYNVALDKVFSIQKDMISEIVGTLNSTLAKKAIDAAIKKPRADLKSYDLYLRARAVTKTYKKELFAEALSLLNQALRIAPDFLEAHFYLSNLHLNSVRFGSTEDEQESLRLARFHAERVMELDDSDYRGHYILGNLHLFADHDHDLALAEYQRALDDNPNDPYILYYMGFLKTLMGEGEEAIKWNKEAKRVNPRYPGWYNYNAAVSHFWIKDYEKALLLAKSGIASNPKALPPRRALIATLVEMGHLDEAKQEAEEYMAIRPNFRLSTFRNTPFKFQKDQDRYFGALRKAGIPD